VSIIETVKHVGVVLIFIGKPLILICGSIWLIRYRLNKKKNRKKGKKKVSKQKIKA